MIKTKKSILTVIAIFLIGIIALSGCSNVKSNVTNDVNGTQETKSALDKIKEKGKLVLGTSADYPPYEFHKEINGKDQIVGFDIAIANEIAKNLGVELEIKDMKFDGLLPALQTGKVDLVIAGMTPTSEREKEVDFSKIYYTALQGIVIRETDKDNYNTLDDLKGKVIGVQKASIQEDIAKEQVEDANLKSLGKVSDLILSLKTNKVDAVIIESGVGKAYVKNNDDLYLMDIQLKDEDGGSAVAVQEGNKELLDVINETIDNLIENNSIEKFVIEATEMAENN